ncbi:hypothetical protein Cpap_0876 [Ruminiclostridium papyrosolvens DSM 2782]|uniref:Glycosyl hydrolase family 98 putative carbohydrate-binding module domain-containing protein n=1 Tax=Ruminiclostridium papyrosolvens DSM 2782 TaxID=588581 RepID=F1TH24_9FIRM|nr:NPCBM/NEW2 domain-containing protein [Ruminiclostridium papyrosolvens]EGD46264.1 hypothetical protein Cpap_0876 [Ruminiclostridium papyrosolvens DSM 2782]WES33014.1 NPCBM/NEW2 domain-containing protein [Ruminiclostridium papyrosolvens DSM 2782]
MKKRMLIQILAGIVIISSIPLITSGASTKRKIDVIYQGIKVVVDNVEKKVSPEPFIYNGEVYVPAKAIAGTLNKKYTFKNNKVYISNTGSAVKEYREIDLAKKPYISADSGELIKVETTDDKVPSTNIYYNPIEQDGTYTIVYALNGLAKTLSGSVGHLSQWGSDKPEMQLSFYDENDKLLYSTGVLKKGMDLLPVNINVTGALQIKIKITVNGSESYVDSYPGIKNLKILTTDY